MLQMGVSENRGPNYSTLNSRILIFQDPKIRYPPNCRKLPNLVCLVNSPSLDFTGFRLEALRFGLGL